MDLHTLTGDGELDAYFKERPHYKKLGEKIAQIIINTVSDEQIADIETQFLVMAINLHQPGTPTHLSALLTQTINTLHNHKEFQKTS
ncbi:hypothetical protein [Janthinobacterium sp. GW458P]|uniref:hypothetical protein n=1 Tax=Janthinobacterium sp. GW458P TaxID=1981504 RepID=UPI000A31F8B8|nr:hypothetical protein [Janthinobacterium sp. GW458P]MBE3023645.1 hypothetical protein [Janthinobacterium sp. GW458P]